MSDWSKKYTDSKWVKSHENGLTTHGSTQPILSVLDVLGIEIKDMFLVGINDTCGSIIVPTKQRANELSTAMRAMYTTKVQQMEFGTDWEVVFDQKDPDGSTPNRFITELSIKDPNAPGGERRVIENGKWLN